jgi:hypothetical protein
VQLFNAGFHSVKILDACRRSRVLTSEHLQGMNFPRLIELFLLSPPSPDEPIETHGDVSCLKEWLGFSLGGRIIHSLLATSLISSHLAPHLIQSVALFVWNKSTNL